VVISGFHLSSERSGFIENEVILSELKAYIKLTKSKYFTGHCTGKKPYEYLSEGMGDAIAYIHTGRIITI
jgi:7,8-dihydropterin-6-yl-methyl-4-(beta-D-ribofuranosyl)aminobenzene 5'-phosphate synthase